MEKTEIILWIQSKSVEGRNILSRNGVRIDNDDKQYMEIYERVNNKTGYRKSEIKENLSIYMKNTSWGEKDSYIIYSNYKEKDVVGREIGFMTYIGQVSNKEEAIKKLVKESKLYGYTCKSKDIKAIRNSTSLSVNKIVTGAIGIGLAILLTWYLLDK